MHMVWFGLLCFGYIGDSEWIDVIYLPISLHSQWASHVMVPVPVKESYQGLYSLSSKTSYR